jgi:adenylate cyclase
MPEAQTMRRLAAILAADVVGYSRMMGENETGTLAALKQHRETLFGPAVSRFNGRIVKLIGDGTLVEFPSVVDAVNCALAVQADAMAKGAGSPITLRIGINLGDIIVEGEDIYGDGVNVAARLEPLAEPGGVCVASIVVESVNRRVDVSFTDGGEVHVKNIERPIRIWKWHPGTTSGVSDAVANAAANAKPARQRPSIAVLPFANMSGEAEQEYFSDGISEDIITDLSKVGGLTVIARNSSFAYKGRNVDIRAVGRELGVSVVLEGSIRRAGNRVRITAQLIDAANGAHLWAERYDRDLTDIFDVQDEVTRQIVAALRVTLTPREDALIAGSAPENIEAHDCVLRARELIRNPSKDRGVFESVLALLERALALDPGYAQAYAGLAWAHQMNYQNRWTEDSERGAQMSLEYADKALALDPNDPLVHDAAAISAIFMKNLERAEVEIEKALALSPSDSLALNARGALWTYRGQPDKGIPYIERSMLLDPAYSQQYLHFLGVAQFMAGRYETAAAHFRERVLQVPSTDFSRAFLAAALGQLGHIEEARQVWKDLKQVNPKYTVEGHLLRLPFQNEADLRRISDGLAKAGLPD